MKALFVCSQAKLRSRTAAICLHGEFDEVKYAGTDKDADIVLTEEMCDWADIIFCMENHHVDIIRNVLDFNNQNIVQLNIEDKYDFLDMELIHMLKIKVGRWLDENERKETNLR